MTPGRSTLNQRGTRFTASSEPGRQRRKYTKTDFDHLLINETPDAVVVTIPDGTVVYWNRGAEAVFGYASAEVIGCMLNEIIVPFDRLEEEGKFFRETLETGAATFESIRRRKDLALVYVDVSSKVIRDSQGQIEFILSSQKDVTNLKVLRDAKLIEAKFRDLLESTPDGIVMVNATGRIVLTNSQADRLFNYQRGELLGKPVEALLPERYRHSHVGQRANYFSQPRTRSMGAGREFYALRRDGSEFPVEISLSPLETTEGRLVMSAVRDITERKRIESILYEKNIELQAAAETKNRFLANMSHELRTPLNSIIGFSEFLVDGKPGPINEKQKEYLEDILNSGQHLLQLINDVLDLAKVEAGKMQLDPEKFSLAKALRDVCAVTKPIAQKKGIRLEVQVAPELGDVTLDQQKFKQILYNLLSNAIKFTDDGGKVTIHVAMHEAGRFKLVVEDTGIGMKTEDLLRLFKEFEQLDPGATRRYEGTGLGLALTRRILELQGGTIDVESEVGQGSRFTVVLPLSIA